MTIDEFSSRSKVRLVLQLPHYAHFVVCLRGANRDFSCSFVLQQPFPIAFGGTPGVAETRLDAILGALQSLEQTVHSERAQAFVAPTILRAIDCILCDTDLVDHLIGVWQAAGNRDPSAHSAAVSGTDVSLPREAHEPQSQDEALDLARIQNTMVLDQDEVGRIAEFGRRLSLSSQVCVQ